MSIRWKSDFVDKQVVTANFERRGWEHVTSHLDDDWDIYWASVGTVRQIFTESGTRLNHGQLVSHFPNHYELTRKVCAAAGTGLRLLGVGPVRCG